MGTRGAYGFRINQKDKITYNHFDSYPEYLCENIMKFISKTPLLKMKDIASRIKLIDPDSIPSSFYVNKYKKFSDLNVSTQSYRDWYCLLRNTQGDLSSFNNGLEHMLDNHEFLYDSLFCEWAYIINLDTKVFEVYKGFNENKSAKGRYSNNQAKDNNDYYGVALLKEIPILKINKLSIDNYISELEAFA